MKLIAVTGSRLRASRCVNRHFIVIGTCGQMTQAYKILLKTYTVRTVCKYTYDTKKQVSAKHCTARNVAEDHTLQIAAILPHHQNE